MAIYVNTFPRRAGLLPRWLMYSHLNGCRLPPLYLSLFFSLDLYLRNANVTSRLITCMNLKLWRALFCYLQIFTAVTLLGAGLLQVTSDLSQVLYLRLQSLNLRESGRYHSGPLITFCRNFCGVRCELGFLKQASLL